MDCDGQHEPARIPVLYEAIHDADIVSGSRYLRDFRQDSLPTPADRLEINRTITDELNARFGLNLTDAFCGFKAYRRAALAELHPTVAGWGMPLQVWVQAACHGLRIKEVAVPRQSILIPNELSAACWTEPRRAWPTIAGSLPSPWMKNTFVVPHARKCTLTRDAWGPLAAWRSPVWPQREH